MTDLIHIPTASLCEMRADASVREDRGRSYCEHLERGNILFLVESPIPLSEDERDLLLRLRQSGARYHKNVSCRPQRNRLTGLAAPNAEDRERLLAVMRAYSKSVTDLLSVLLPNYAAAARLDLTSFRPQEERGRPARTHARNDLLHIDSFPNRPTFGDRIMRVFTNINPVTSRVWITSETFDGLIERFAKPNGAAGPRLGTEQPGTLVGGVGKTLARMAARIGLPVRQPSPYDEFMHQLHNFLKENTAYQESCPKTRWEFPPNSTWIVFTDMVSHAVVAGQFALEQTCIIPMRALALPEKAPYNILQRLHP